MAGIANPFNLDLVSAGLTTSTTAYAAGDQLGTEITAAHGGPNGALVVVTALSLVDFAKITGAIEARVFKASTTPAADNAAASWSDADEAKIVPGGRIDIPGGTVDANNSTAAIPNLWVGPFVSNASGQFFIDLITRLVGGHTFFGAATDLKLNIGGYYFT